MAAPNIVGVTTITGITTAAAIDSVHAKVILSNAASSSKVLKVNTILLTNMQGSTVGLATVKYHLAAGTAGAAPGAGTSISLVNQLGISTGTAIVPMDKASTIYLEENRSLSYQCNVADVLDILVSYDEIQ